MRRVPVFSQRATMAAGMLACIAIYSYATWRVDKDNLNWYLSIGDETRRAIHQFDALGVHPAPHSRVAFVNDPFPDTYLTLFLAALYWKDPAMEINLQRTYRMPDNELARMDYILDYNGASFVVVKP